MFANTSTTTTSKSTTTSTSTTTSNGTTTPDDSDKSGDNATIGGILGAIGAVIILVIGFYLSKKCWWE